MKRRQFTVLAVLLLTLAAFTYGEKCPDIPLPTVTAKTVTICHPGYVSQYDTTWHVPRVVSYELTRAGTLGCLPRQPNFYAEPGTAKPAEYAGSGWDLGHMMPAEDASTSAETSHDSFSMANVSPQLPELNRQEWERLEESVRAWAYERGDLLVYVGPIFSDRPKTFGNHIGIPSAFFKVLVDQKTGEVLAFELPQKAEAKGDVAPWLATVEDIEGAAGITFPVTGSTRYTQDRRLKVALWPLDLAGWRAAHRKACSK
jgi:endonuclease G